MNPPASANRGLCPGARIVYFLPENRDADRVVRVDRVESTLLRYQTDRGLNLTIVPIPGGTHASAESNVATYREAIERILTR